VVSLSEAVQLCARISDSAPHSNGGGGHMVNHLPTILLSRFARRIPSLKPWTSGYATIKILDPKGIDDSKNAKQLSKCWLQHSKHRKMTCTSPGRRGRLTPLQKAPPPTPDVSGSHGSPRLPLPPLHGCSFWTEQRGEEGWHRGDREHDSEEDGNGKSCWCLTALAEADDVGVHLAHPTLVKGHILEQWLHRRIHLICKCILYAVPGPIVGSGPLPPPPPPP